MVDLDISFLQLFISFVTCVLGPRAETCRFSEFDMPDPYQVVMYTKNIAKLAVKLIAMQHRKCQPTSETTFIYRKSHMWVSDSLLGSRTSGRRGGRRRATAPAH